MKKTYFILLFVLNNLGYAQIEDAWVYFKDKPSSSTFLANPLTMLTQRSLDRRVVQNIGLDITDVPVEQSYINQIIDATGITVMAKSKWMNALHIRGTQTNIQALTTISFVNKVVYANHSLNSVGRVSQKISISSDEIVPVNKVLDIQSDYNYGDSQNQIEMLNGHLLHQQNFTGQGKIIAVLDSGFTGVNTALPFQNLVINGQILGGYNFPDRNDTYFSRNDHGTFVLSTMGGFLDGQLVGTAPSAQYYLFITEDVNSENPVEESYWVEALELADYYGVDIINSSLGYFDYDNVAYSHKYEDMIGNKTFSSRGANMAFNKGIVVVVSAGNSGATSNPHIATPADAFGSLAVGAVSSTEAYVSFSSIGPSYEIPNRVKPDVCAKGERTTVSNSAGSIITSNGTSFSSPVIAGMAATFWSAVPNLTAQQVVNYIKQSCDDFLVPTHQKGYGIPDFQLALNNAFSIEVVSDETLFNVFPNPTKVDLFFQFKKAFEKGKIEILNSIGQKIMEKEFKDSNNAFINVENFPEGIYYYKYQSSKLYKGKFVKE